MGNIFNSAEEERTFTDPVHNQKVLKVQKMLTPTDSARLVPHAGVKVTTEQGSHYMVHKVGKLEDGQSSTEVSKMSDVRPEDWSESGDCIDVTDRNLKIGHFVEASGPGYNLLFDNCHGASNRMVDLNKPKWVRDLEWMERNT